MSNKECQGRCESRDAVMDWYSHFVLSPSSSTTLEADFCVSALEEALNISKPRFSTRIKALISPAGHFLEHRRMRVSRSVWTARAEPSAVNHMTIVQNLSRDNVVGARWRDADINSNAQWKNSKTPAPPAINSSGSTIWRAVFGCGRSLIGHSLI